MMLVEVQDPGVVIAVEDLQTEVGGVFGLSFGEVLKPRPAVDDGELVSDAAIGEIEDVFQSIDEKAKAGAAGCGGNANEDDVVVFGRG